MSWQQQKQTAEDKYGSGEAAQKAARRVWRGLGYRNISKEIWQAERAFELEPDPDDDLLTRAIRVWRWRLDRSATSLTAHLKYAVVKVDSDENAILERLYEAAEENSSGWRVLYLSENNAYLVEPVENVIWFPRPVTLFDHANHELAIMRMPISDLVAATAEPR